MMKRKTSCCALKKLLQTGICAGMAISLVQMPVLAQSNDLINIASRGTIQVPSSESASRGPENLVDGDLSTLWVTAGAQWPATLVFAQDPAQPRKISKVVLKFEEGHPDWSVDVKVSHVLNSVVDSPIEDVHEVDHSYAEDFVFTFDESGYYSHINIEISNPKNGQEPGQFWPGLAEVEIWAEPEEEDLEPDQAVTNVASKATISSVGNAGDPSNLVDGNYASLYVFNNGGMSTLPDGAWVNMSLDKGYAVHSLEVAFEHLDPDTNNFEYTFDVYGKNARATEWTRLFASQKAKRLDGQNVVELAFDEAVDLKDLRFVITSITSSGGDPWPAFAEIKIMAEEIPGTVDEDPDNIAYGKPVHSNVAMSTIDRLTDGVLTNTWMGDSYPAYIDVDLQANYELDDVQIFMPTTGYSQYTIYTSLDGVNFDRVASKQDDSPASIDGNTYEMEGKEARYVRLYVEYQSTSSKALVNEIKVHGTLSSTPIQEAAPVEVVDYAQSGYDVTITDQDTIEEVQGIVTRRLGAQYVDWFDFELAQQENGYDYFTITNANGKVHIKGNTGVSLATGLNRYLKDVCHVNLSQVGDQAQMPESIAFVEEEIHQETKFPVRYSYNFCTLSYSMAFWGEQEWRDELDWLALNGVNVVLDATGEEEVWRRFLGELGYSHEEIKDFIAGPAYYAWFYMANMYGYGGPLHDSWFAQRTELARKNHLIMQKLGMQPVLQGFSGMVPVDIQDKDPDVEIIAQGKWCSFQRPAMLKTDSDCFDDYASLFYRIQQDVYGDVTNYYATDPFHEGGNTGNMDVSVISRKVLGSMMESDPDAIWVIQSWQSNPTTPLLNGIADHKDHALILDLYAERQPHWSNTGSGYGGSPEFAGTPWVYCMLNNFGGRLGLHGYLTTLATAVADAANQAEHMAGIGITPEASQNNPILYELLFETIWQEDGDHLEHIDLDQWLNDYARRRYGSESEAAVQALEILNETVYNPEMNPGTWDSGQGAAETVVNARPALSISSASSWGYTNIKYDKKDLEQALSLLLQDYEEMKDSGGYAYDVVSVAQQVLSNTAQEYHKKFSAAFQAGDLEGFTYWSDRFLDLIDLSDDLLSTQEIYLLGNWTQAAGRMAEDADDFTRDLYDLNAKSLVTTWGSLEQANTGGLRDYSNRQWAGLTKDYYKGRWQLWIDERKKELAGEDFINMSSADWFAWEWNWVRNSGQYSETPSDLDIQQLAKRVLDEHSVTNMPVDPAQDDSRDVPADQLSADAGSMQYTTGSEGPASNVLDGSTSTIWHSLWAGDTDENLWIELQSDELLEISALRYLPRQTGTNGIITGYRIEVSDDAGQSWQEVANGTWTGDASWKIAEFDAVQANRVRLYAVTSMTDTGIKFASAAEIRLVMAEVLPEEANKLLLKQAIDYALNAKNSPSYPYLSAKVKARFDEALEQAQAVDADPKATQTQVNEAWMKLSTVLHMLNFTANKDDLQNLVNECLEIDLNLYVDDEAVKTEFSQALAWAQEVLDNENALDETSILPAFNRLESARDALRALDLRPVENANKVLLKAAIDYAQAAMSSEEYANVHEKVKAALEKALNRAIEVYEDESASQAVVNQAWSELCNILHMLDFTSSKMQLAELVSLCEDIDLDQYVDDEAVKQEFLDALAQAREVLENPDALDETSINPAYERLLAAKEALEALDKKPDVQIDTSRLAKIIALTEHTDLDKYLDLGNTKAEFTSALAHAREVLADPQSQEEVDAATMALSTAYLNLRLKPNEGDLDDYLKADKELLKSAIDYALQLQGQEDYDNITPATKAIFEEALAKAQDVYDNENATQEEVDEAYNELLEAIHSLNLKGDKSELEQAIEEAETLNPDDYVDGEDVKAEFEEALEHAREVAEDENATDEEVEEALKRLEEAMEALKGLEKKPDVILDVSVLERLIRLTQDTDLSLYVQDETIEAFSNALIVAKAQLENPESQSDIDMAVSGLSNAYMNLRLKADEELLKALQSLKELVENATTSLYSQEELAQIDAAKEALSHALSDVDRLGKEEGLALLNAHQDVAALIEKRENATPNTSNKIEQLVTAPSKQEAAGANKAVSTAAGVGMATTTGLFAAAGAALLGLLKKKKK